MSVMVLVMVAAVAVVEARVQALVVAAAAAAAAAEEEEEEEEEEAAAAAAPRQQLPSSNPSRCRRTPAVEVAQSRTATAASCCHCRTARARPGVERSAQVAKEAVEVVVDGGQVGPEEAEAPEWACLA